VPSLNERLAKLVLFGDKPPRIMIMDNDKRSMTQVSYLLVYGRKPYNIPKAFKKRGIEATYVTHWNKLPIGQSGGSLGYELYQKFKAGYCFSCQIKLDLKHLPMFEHFERIIDEINYSIIL
jgi:hypothetical protein